MIRQDNGISKASLSTYFDFGGIGSGLFVPNNSSNALHSALSTTPAAVFPFLKEYQMCVWFRIENFEVQQHVEMPSPNFGGRSSPMKGRVHIHTYIHTYIERKKHMYSTYILHTCMYLNYIILSEANKDVYTHIHTCIHTNIHTYIHT